MMASLSIKRLQYLKTHPLSILSLSHRTIDACLPTPDSVSLAYNKMSYLSSERILKAQAKLGNQHFLKELRHSVQSNQQKISREVYNAQNRNIKKFAQEWATFQKKMDMKDNRIPSKTVPIKKGEPKYQQNQLMELSFAHKFRPKPQNHVPNEDISALTIRNSSIGISSGRNLTFKTSLKNRYSYRVNYVDSRQREGLGARQKSNSFTKAERISPRKRVATQWELTPSHVQRQSRLSFQKRQNTTNSLQYHTTEDYIIDVTREKMDRFIRNLHRLQWAHGFLKKSNRVEAEESREYRSHMRRFQFDADSPIDQQAINHMVSRRYHLHTNYLEDVYEQRDRQLTEQSTSFKSKRLADSAQYPLLSSLAKHSILHLLQKNLQHHKKSEGSEIEPQRSQPNMHFALPYSEFISHRETKNSIYQLVGMTAKLALKLAFSVFDKNRNGLIDEHDLIQLISLSRTLPALQIDIAVLSRGMLTFRQSKKPFFKSRIVGDSRQKEIRERNTTLVSKQSEDRSQIMAIEEEKDSDSESGVNQKSLSTSRFSIDKLYIFLREKEKNGRTDSSKMSKATIQALNFPMFCKAFEYKRPYLIYDLLQFIFGASVEDFKDHIQKEINMHLSKLRKNNAIQAHKQEEETLEEKWNKKLKFSNGILEQFVRSKQLS